MSDADPLNAMLPLRGLLPLHAYDGGRRDVQDIRRAMRFNRVVFKVLKLDLAEKGFDPAPWPELLDFAETLDLRLSLRTDTLGYPERLDELKERGLLDIFLCPPGDAPPLYAAWLPAAKKAGIPLRLQLESPWELPEPPEQFAQILAEHGVKSVNISRADFLGNNTVEAISDAQAKLKELQNFGIALHKRGVEVNFLLFPPAALPDTLKPCAYDMRRFFHDYQHYNAESYALAYGMYHRKNRAVSAILNRMNTREYSRLSRLDNLILRLTLHKHPGMVDFIGEIHRSLRLVSPVRALPPAEGQKEAFDIDYDVMNPELLEEFKKIFPGVALDEKPGGASTYHKRPRYVDPVDQARLDRLATQKELAREANDKINNVPFSREITATEYLAENAHTIELPGAHRWCSIANVEKRSSVLAQLEPPFTLSATFGGGDAEYIGFALGRYARILCPMESSNHRLVLHVDAQGGYVLLRDGEAVEPVSFAGDYFVPQRIGSRVEPRLALWNINKELVTQSVLLWDAPKTQEACVQAKYSIVIVSTRYARRLQAALLSIARQENFNLDSLEVIVAYVPGLDANEDVMDSVGLAYPQLRIIRAPFAAKDALSKGYLINESAKLASGEWVIVMDSDIVLLPHTFNSIEKRGGEAHFIAPDGRKMLDRECTAKILLGLINPSECWQTLLDGPGELRKREADGLPIGFFQCVKKACFKKVQYEELRHFEGADWRFAQDIRKTFGPEIWLDGLPVLHLDHGGSHWYGTQKHY